MKGVEQQQFWGHQKGNPEDEINYTTYLSDLKAIDIFDRALGVTGSATAGACIGSAIGCAAGGVGAIPGMLIGIGIGAGVGFVGANAYDVGTYLTKYKSDLNEQGQESFNAALGDVMNDPADLCAISKMIAVDPVIIRGETGTVYERSVLLQYIANCKGAKPPKPICSPISRKLFTLNDIQICYEQVAKLGKRTDQLLNNEQLRRQLRPEQLKGLEFVRRDTIAKAERFFNKETNVLLKQTNSKKLTPRQAALKMTHLADILEPVIGEEAINARVEIDVEAIKIPPALLAKNANEESKVPEPNDV